MQEKILVIDDHADSGKTLMMAMQMLGNDVLLAPDGESALRKIASFIPTIVLCDICMPGMLGYDVCIKMKADPRLKNTLFIAQTAIDTESGKQRAADSGFDHHMVKPVDIDGLVQLIKSVRSKNPVPDTVLRY